MSLSSPSSPASHALVAHFTGKLQYETDASDVHADQERGVRFALVDSRGDAAWAQGRITGALHLPTAEIARRAPLEIPAGLPVVTYCWGPGCNGATRAALEFAKLGYQVKEMIGGFEYWAREGYPVENDHGRLTREPDPLTAPVDAIGCAC
ncbi:rhodanese-like domain-containing protein [Nonomuraea sp. CA-218870]|uniref:rhodanese-like domain-containing protein n=1 Tax=Nonomuraea sp. CA-218870 TaxID=3239998 RepID=UPI003D929D2D